MNDAKNALGEFDVDYDDHVAKISVVGQGMAHQSGVAVRMFSALARAGINIQMITTSEIKISTLVVRDQALSALRAVHEAFELEKAPPVSPAVSSGEPHRPVAMDVVDVVERLRGLDMEELTIDGISLDDSQGRVTIQGIPDRPGIAEKLFSRIAAADIFVDMIVQSYGHDGKANLSFTVPKSHIKTAISVTHEIAREFGTRQVSHSSNVAKLSVSGIGLRSHTGVAIRMFQALSQAKINLEMINTSEVQVNVVVDGLAGPAALDCLQDAFQDVLK
jgi:aspartate kinase